jgi:hypothetical protein
MGFYRRLKDIQFKLVELEEDQYLANFSMHFKVQNQMDVLAFKCENM